MIQRRRQGRSYASRPHHPRGSRSYKVVCSNCGKEAVIPVPPPNDKKLLCMECFNKREIPREEP